MSFRTLRGRCARALQLTALGALALQASGAETVPPAQIKPRLFVLTDIGNEPDDQMSLVRLLVYSNVIDIEGLVASTSTWKRTAVSPETIRSVIDSYGAVRGNLQKHDSDWPTPAQLKSVVAAGRAAYGMAGLEGGSLSEGAALLIKAARRDDVRPLWVTLWGGGSTLAEALRALRAGVSPEELDRLVARLRVYSISDQDDAGPWIRREFPKLFYIVKPSPADGAEYASATWTGISGDAYYRNGEGADGSTVSQEWLQTHIRSKGALGAHYPRHMFIMEGDTPSFLGLIPNGLESAANPGWGGWGGRYVLRQPYGETRPIWTQGGDLYPRVTSADTVLGVDGQWHSSDQATIWRWRRAFQHDFAARMDWSIRDRAHANHPPRVSINGDAGIQPLVIDLKVGDTVRLDASGSSDPDNNALDYEWFHYAEAGAEPDVSLGAVTMEGSGEAALNVRADATCRPNWLANNSCGAKGIAHLVLAVTDRGTPSLTRYRRVILRIQAR